MKTKKSKQQQTVDEIVNNFKTKYPQGFTEEEQKQVFQLFPNMDIAKFSEALGYYTAMTIDGETLMYHRDLIIGIRCALENRGVNLVEFD